MQTYRKRNRVVFVIYPPQGEIFDALQVELCHVRNKSRKRCLLVNREAEDLLVVVQFDGQHVCFVKGPSDSFQVSEMERSRNRRRKFQELHEQFDFYLTSRSDVVVEPNGGVQTNGAQDNAQTDGKISVQLSPSIPFFFPIQFHIKCAGKSKD